MAQSNPTRVLTNADLVHVIDELDKNQMRKNIGVVDNGSETEIRRLDHRIDVANTDIEAIREAIAEDEFDPEIGYTLGSYVWHGNKLFVKVYNSNEPEAWNPQHWNEISVLNQNNASYFIYGTATYEEVQLAFAKRQAVYAIKSITNGVKVGVFGSAYNGGYKFTCTVDGNVIYVWTLNTSDEWSETIYSGGGSGTVTYVTINNINEDFNTILQKIKAGEPIIGVYPSMGNGQANFYIITEWSDSWITFNMIQKKWNYEEIQVAEAIMYPNAGGVAGSNWSMAYYETYIPYNYRTIQGPNTDHTLTAEDIQNHYFDIVKEIPGVNDGDGYTMVPWDYKIKYVLSGTTASLTGGISLYMFKNGVSGEYQMDFVSQQISADRYLISGMTDPATLHSYYNRIRFRIHLSNSAAEGDRVNVGINAVIGYFNPT